MVLAYYESIRQVSHQMLEAARRSDWAALADAEAIAESLIARLRTAGDPRQCLVGEGRRRRFEILRHVLADDAEIRNLVQPELRQLDADLGVGPCARPGKVRRDD